MARNPVQFQKGISLNEFLSLYGTEQQCFDALYHWRWPNGFVCPNCGHDRGCQLTTHKLQQCYRCNRQTSITAGTIFEATKLPLTVWFQGIYFMTQDKKGCSAMKLHRHLGISYNAAWRMRHKLMQVMMERDRAHPLGVPPKLIIFNGFLVGARAQHCQGQIRQRDRFATTVTIPTRNGDFGATRAGSEWPARRAHSSACPNA